MSTRDYDIRDAPCANRHVAISLRMDYTKRRENCDDFQNGTEFGWAMDVAPEVDEANAGRGRVHQPGAEREGLPGANRILAPRNSVCAGGNEHRPAAELALQTEEVAGEAQQDCLA